MDIRPFHLNEEVSVLVHGPEVVDRMRKVENDDQANSDQLRRAGPRR